MATNPRRISPQPKRTNGRGAEQGAASLPAFRAKRGESAVALVREIGLSPPAAKIGVSRDGRWLAASAACRRAGNLALYDVSDGSVVWRATLEASSSGVFALDDGGCIALTQRGRIGAGSTEIHFVGPEGQLHASVRLDDKLTEAQRVDGGLIVGCRDGRLLMYDLTGALCWTYRVPAHAGFDRDPHNLYQRSCPYFIRATCARDHILVSSWDRLFMLDRSGVLRWTWQTKTEPTTFRYPVASRPARATVEHYRLLGVARTASPDDVRHAFRRKAFETHPDRNRDDPQAAEHFKEAMRAYEAIKAAGHPRPVPVSFSIQINGSSGANSICGLAVGDDGRGVANSCDGALTFLDATGRVMETRVVGAGPGTVHTSPNLACIVYADWQRLHFYTSDGSVHAHPVDRLYHVAVRGDGQRVVAWFDRQLLAFDGTGQLLADLEFAKTVSSVAFLSDDQLIVAAGKLLWFGFTPPAPDGAA